MRHLCVLVCILAGWLALAAPAATSSLRVGAPAGPSNLGNPFVSLISQVTQTTSTLFDALTQIDDTGAIRPELALSWQATSPTTWIFVLRPSITFSNGEPFDAAAVKTVIDWLTSQPGRATAMGAELKAVTGARVVDPLTVEISTSAPDAILPKRLSLVMMVAPKAWTTLGVEGFARTPSGTGAYTVQEWTDRQGRTQLRANPTSWRAPIDIERIEVVYPLRDSIVRRQALESGEIDITVQVAFDDLAALRAAGFTVLVQPVPQIRALALPNARDEHSPLRDVRVRQALNYAVDKESIAKVIYDGAVPAVGQGAIPGTVGYNPGVKPYPYDPARARALLAEAGYPDGFSFTAEVEVGQAEVIYLKAAQDLARVGVNLTVRAVVAQEWLRKYFSGDWGGADSLSLVWNAGAYRDTIRAIESYSCANPKPFFCEPSLMPDIAATGAMFDPRERDLALQKIMARLHDLAPSLFLVAHANTVVARPGITNIEAGERGLRFEKMRVAADPRKR